LQITVKLYGVLRVGRFKEEDREVPPGATVRTVAEQLRIPAELLGTVLIAGVHASVDSLLSNGDVVSLLPVLGGG
jgi:molybdopterin converting factor small subunit